MITKSGFLYRISAKQNGKEIQREIKSFTPIDEASLLGKLIITKTNIQLSDIQIDSKSVVYAIDESNFLEKASIIKEKKVKNNE